MSALEEMPAALETELSELEIDNNGLETRAVNGRNGGSDHDNESDHDEGSDWYDSGVDKEDDEQSSKKSEIKWRIANDISSHSFRKKRKISQTSSGSLNR
ncbi:hypothetical protein BDD12DRAFT_899556 [Trichophaea hybrida]|nr:hypothetical protein BDD12DRAFT_899556 [Trichophaea hybrida]